VCASVYCPGGHRQERPFNGLWWDSLRQALWIGGKVPTSIRPPRPQTVLTALTQTPVFVAGNRSPSGSGQPPPAPTGAVREDHFELIWLVGAPAGQVVSVTAADDADCADANPARRFHSTY
jgi:hypothetical protein